PADLHRRIVNVNPIVWENIGSIQNQCHNQEIAIAQGPCAGMGSRPGCDLVDQLAHSDRADHIAGGIALGSTVMETDLDVPALLLVPIGKAAQLASLEYPAAALLPLARGGVPHHAGATPRVLEALNQRFHGRLICSHPPLEAMR